MSGTESLTTPRLVVAGLAGGTGKTLVTLGLVRALARSGRRVLPWKKGPDFIDAAWLGAAATLPGRNLDTFLMDHEAILGSLGRATREGGESSRDVIVVEGNRGLFDGLDVQGSHSTARLAQLIGAPVVLVVDATKTTRTVAALVLGCQKLDPAVDLRGVILNRVGTRRQQALISDAVRAATGLDVLGAIPRLPKRPLLDRHLGLVTSVEHPNIEQVLDGLADLVTEHVNLARVEELAREARPLASACLARGLVATTNTHHGEEPSAAPPRPDVRIGVLRDRAFSFYYPENLEALEVAGAELVFLSPLADTDVPDVDAVYAGGGFPEEYASELAHNGRFREQLRRRIEEGMPVWAECGGLAYLARTLLREGTAYPMVGAIPAVVEQNATPRGHGYVQARVDRPNPFLPEGTELRGHEFHYTQLKSDSTKLQTALQLERGTGLGHGRDGIVEGRVFATYMHVHALGAPGWATRVVEAARAGFVRSAASVRPAAPTDLDVGSDGERATAERIGSRERAGRRLAERHAVRTRINKGRPRGTEQLGARIRAAIEQGRSDELQGLVASEPKSVRHLLGLTYQHEASLRVPAARALAMASKYHPHLVENVVRRLVWAMNDESGTNAATAPEVILAIAEDHPELLLPMIPDLVRLAGDEALHEGLAQALRAVVRACPGKVAAGLQRSLERRLAEGECCAVGRSS